jgi:hypothetical protein
MEDVVPIFVALAPNLFHHNNVGVTYVRTSNFRMEAIRFIPLYFMAMPHSMVIVTEAPFTTTLAHTICWYEVKTTNSKGNKPCEYAYKDAHRGGHDFCWTTIRSRKKKIKTTKNTETFKTFRIS